jgi:hypothetical protein
MKESWPAFEYAMDKIGFNAEECHQRLKDGLPLFEQEDAEEVKEMITTAKKHITSPDEKVKALQARKKAVFKFQKEAKKSVASKKAPKPLTKKERSPLVRRTIEKTTTTGPSSKEKILEESSKSSTTKNIPKGQRWFGSVAKAMQLKHQKRQILKRSSSKSAERKTGEGTSTGSKAPLKLVERTESEKEEVPVILKTPSAKFMTKGVEVEDPSTHQKNSPKGSRNICIEDCTYQVIRSGKVQVCGRGCFREDPHEVADCKCKQHINLPKVMPLLPPVPPPLEVPKEERRSTKIKLEPNDSEVRRSTRVKEESSDEEPEVWYCYCKEENDYNKKKCTNKDCNCWYCKDCDRVNKEKGKCKKCDNTCKK